ISGKDGCVEGKYFGAEYGVVDMPYRDEEYYHQRLIGVQRLCHGNKFAREESGNQDRQPQDESRTHPEKATGQNPPVFKFLLIGITITGCRRGLYAEVIPDVMYRVHEVVFVYHHGWLPSSQDNSHGCNEYMGERCNNKHHTG